MDILAYQQNDGSLLAIARSNSVPSTESIVASHATPQEAYKLVANNPGAHSHASKAELLEHALELGATDIYVFSLGAWAKIN